MYTRVKICGITRIEDAQAAVRAGADAIGLVFYPPSPRYLSLEQAAAIAAVAPPFVSVVGVFVDAAPDAVRAVLGKVPLRLLQFQGEETPATCRGFGIPYIKSLRMQDGIDLHAQAATYLDAAGLLLDAYTPDQPGGTGRTFDWKRVPRDLNRPVILAGGLTVENVAQAIAQARPYAVDVSSGVERRPGIKDADKIAAFINNVRGV